MVRSSYHADNQVKGSNQMIPTLKDELSSQLLNLENYIINHSCDIEHWFRNQWIKYQPLFMHQLI